MQNRMDEKNRTALERWGARTILTALVNVPARGHSDCDASAREFLERFGPLRQKPSADVIALANLTASKLPEPIDDVVAAANVYRNAWPPQTGGAVEAMERFIESLFILHVDGPYDRPAIRLDFYAGSWQPSPRTLMEHLAVELVRSRKMLHRCERPECKRYFVKEFSRDRYCSNPCAEEMRARGQRQWAMDHRDELIARRRKARKKPRKK